MRIERLLIEGFRKLTDRYELADLGVGLTVVSGDNEEGKSTVLAALKAALFLRHTISGKTRSAMMPFGHDATPYLELDIRKGDEHFRLEKRFKRGGVKLVTPTNTLDGETAERKCADILGYNLATRGETKAENMGLPGLFWVDQATTFDGIEIGKIGRDQLTKTITQEVETVTTSDLAKQLSDRAKERCDYYWQPSRGQPREPLLGLQRQMDSLAERRDELQQVRDTLEDGLARLQGLYEKRRLLLAADRIGEAKSRLGFLRNQVAETETQKRALAIERERLKTAQHSLEVTDRKWTDRKELQHQIDGLLAESKMAADNHRMIKKQFDDMNPAYMAAKIRAEEGRASFRRRKSVVSDTVLRAEQAKILSRLRSLQAAAERMKVLQDRKHAASHSIERNPCDDAAMKKLEGFQQELREAEIKLRAASTRMVFKPLHQGAIQVDGENWDSETPLEISQDTVLDLVHFGKIFVEPGGKEATAARHAMAKAKADYDGYLAELGMADLVGAREHAAARQRAQEAFREASIGLNELLTSQDVDSVDSLHDLIAQVQGTLQFGPEEFDDVDFGDEQILEAQLKLQRFENEIADQNETYEELERRRSSIRQELIRAETVTQAIEDQVTQLTNRLGNERSLESDVQLKQAFVEAERALKDRVARSAIIEERLGEIEPDAAAQALAQAERRLDHFIKEQQELDDEIAKLRLELRIKGGEGIGEQLAEVEGLLQRAQSEYERVEHQAKAWRLLHQELGEAERSRRDQIVEPILKRVQPYLGQLFQSGDKLALDPGSFSMVHLQRGDVAEPYDQLSIGTREQLAVLVRLACAQLVIDCHGESPPIILDDALVYADERRFEVMTTILEQAAKQMQILILTCRPRDYFGLKARFIRLEDCRTRPAPS